MLQDLEVRNSIADEVEVIEESEGRQNGAPGVDLNRNWPYMWGMDDEGSSNDTCSEVYRGPAPGSEEEVKGIMKLMLGTKVSIAMGGFQQNSVKSLSNFF